MLIFRLNIIIHYYNYVLMVCGEKEIVAVSYDAAPLVHSVLTLPHLITKSFFFFFW